MSGFKDLSFNQLVAEIIFDDLKEKILLCCDMMHKDLTNNNCTIRNNEPEIRDYLLENYLQSNAIRGVVGLEDFSFQPEVRVRNTNIGNCNHGNVDIKILIQKLSFIDTEAYFIIECKRIDGTTYLNKAYVSEGVCRFVSTDAYYSTYQDRNFMLGFVVNDIDINDNIQKINSIQNINDRLTVLQEIERMSTNRFVYQSRYLLNSNIILLLHMFYDFSSVIG